MSASPNPSPERFNADHARRFLSYLIDPAVGCAELRIFRATHERTWIVAADQYSKTLGGWYSRVDSLVVDLQRVKGVSAFVTVNPVIHDLLARTDHKIAKIERGGGTNDSQIVCLRWAFLDFDVDRPADISATDAEHALALDARDKFLAAHPEIRAGSIWGSSGNGGLVLVRLPDLPNDEPSNHLVKRFIAQVGRSFSKGKVKVDPKTCNASRVMGIPGTRKCKGSERPDRPWRLATLDSPEGHQPSPIDLREWLEINGDDTDAVADVHVGPPALYGPGGHAAPPWQAGAANAPGTPGTPGTPSLTGRPNVPAHSAAQSHSDSRSLNRVAKFVAAIPGAISGRGGHNQTFSVATALVKGFDLDTTSAWPFLQGYNTTCVPPWTDADLWHKLESASDKPDTRPRGYLWGEGPGGLDELVRSIARPPRKEGAGAGGGDDGLDPPDDEGAPAPVETCHQIARSLLAQHYSGPFGCTLKFWREEFHAWDGSCYRPLPKKEVAAMVSGAVERQFIADHAARLMMHAIGTKAGGGGKKDKGPPSMKSVTCTVTADVTQALSSLCVLNVINCPAQPAWLDGRGPWPADEVLPTRDALVHMPSLVGGPDGTGQPDPAKATMRPTPNFFGRYALSYNYDPDAPEPVEWLRFLGKLWPDDPESIAMLQEWIGYLLTPDTSQQKIAMLIGPKRSGKGTITRVITALMGADNVVNPTLRLLEKDFGISSLLGKQAAIVTDARISGKTDTAIVVERLLSISGEDSQTIDRKYKTEMITAKLQTRFMIVSNELPNIKDASGALAGRMLILELTRSFFGEEDIRLLGKLLPELPGILKWAVAGWARLRAQGSFTVPRASQDATRAMQDLASPIGAFLRERCALVTGAYVPVQELYMTWKNWCMAKGRDHAGEEEGFGRLLRAAAPGTKKSRPRIEGGGRMSVYMGVRLLTAEEMAAADDSDSDGDGGDGADDGLVLPGPWVGGAGTGGVGGNGSGGTIPIY